MEGQPLQCVEEMVFESLPAAVLTHARRDPNSMSNAWLNKHGDVERSFTRAQLWHFSSLVGQMLVEDCGVKTGDRVMIVYPFGIDWIVAFLACCRVGVTVVSVYPPNPNRLGADIPKFSHFVQDSQAYVALTTRAYHHVVRGSNILRKWPAGLKWVVTDNYKNEPTSSTPDLTKFDVEAMPESPALIQYTSGSTADPKGVVLSHRNISHQMQIQRGLVRADARVSYVGWAPQYHDMGLFAVLSPLFNGKDTSYAMSPLDWLQNPILWPAALERYKGTLTVGPNFSYALTCRRLREKNLRFDCSSVEMAVVGAEPTELQTLQDAAEVMCIPRAALHNSYGLAEHGLLVSSYGSSVVDPVLSAGSVAFSRALGIHVCIVTEDSAGYLREAEDGTQGEVCVSSASVGLGYYNRPETSEATFRARIEGMGERRFLRTGDMGLIRNGQLYISSRIKDLIIINGRNYAPSDLEKAAEAAHAAAHLRPGSSVAFQSRDEGVVVACEVRARQARELSMERLAGEIRAAVEVECGLTVDRVVLLPERSVPKTTSGKVQRARTTAMFRDGLLSPLASVTAEAPGLHCCRSLREMMEASGVEDWTLTLAENGLSSLQVTELINAAKQRIGVDLDYESVASLSASDILCKMETAEQQAPPPMQTYPDVDVPRLALGTVLLRQTLVLLLTLTAVLVSTLPPVALIEHAFEPGSEWWFMRGRGGPLVIAAVVLWMVTFSVVCVIVSVVCLSRRQHPRFVALWSWQFTGWMLVQRVMGVWEYAVGRFLLSTPWLNLFYSLLGADVRFSAKIDTFLRDPAMISLGAGASVKGSVYGRAMVAGGIHFGAVQVGAGASVGAMSVVMPDTLIAHGVVVEPCTVLPPFTSLDAPHTRWHGNPARQRANLQVDALRPDTTALPVSGPTRTLWVTRAALPLLVLLVTACSSALASRVVPAVQANRPVWSVESVKMTVSYFVVIQLSGLCMLLLTLALKWSFLSPFLTDRLAAVVLTTFFPYVEKTILVKLWHRAFGMSIGDGSSVLLVRFCSPSAAHRCKVGSNTVVFNGFLAPPDPPTLWSWLAGRSPSPWAGGRDIVIGDSVGVFVQCRLEGRCSVGDGAQCAAFSRMESGTDVQAGATIVGDPAVQMPYGSKAALSRITVAHHTASSDDLPCAETPPLQAAPGLALMALHVLLLVLRLSYLACMATVGVQAMLAVDEASQLSPYLRIPLRVGLAITWVLAGLMAEVLCCKWLFVGRAVPGEFAIMGVRGVLEAHLAACESAMHSLLGALLYGLWPYDLYLRLLGFRLPVGRTLLLSGNYAASDADLVTIGDGAVLDDNAYLIAHQATVTRLRSDRSSVGPRSVLHPQGVLFPGSVEQASVLFPRCKAMGPLYGGAHQTWAGCPARAVATVATSLSDLSERGAADKGGRGGPRHAVRSPEGQGASTMSVGGLKSEAPTEEVARQGGSAGEVVVMGIESGLAFQTLGSEGAPGRC